MSKPDQHIVASCGGFGMEPDNLVLDEFVLQIARSDIPRVCFIPTASGDNDNYTRRFYQSFTTLNCKPCHLSLFQPPTDDLLGFICEQDVIYVGGGNTRNMLLIWRDWSVDKFLRQALEEGTVLTGLSAGSICWFEEATTDSFAPIHSQRVDSMECLGFLQGSHCPYYDSENRRAFYHKEILAGTMSDGFATEVGTALHFTNGTFSEAISSRGNANAYRVEKGNEEISAIELEIRKL